MIANRTIQSFNNVDWITDDAVRDNMRDEQDPLEHLITIVKMRYLKRYSHVMRAKSLFHIILQNTTLGKQKKNELTTTSLAELEALLQRFKHWRIIEK